MRTLLVVGLCLLMVPVASAATLDDANNALRFYRDSGAGEYVISAPGASYAFGLWGNGNPYTGNGREWAFRLVDIENPVLEFDTTGKIEVSLEVGGGTGEVGQCNVAFEIKQGDTVIATGAAQEVLYTSNQKVVTWSETPQVGSVDLADGDVVMRVYTSTHRGLGARMDLEPSTMTWPLLAPPVEVEPGVSIQNLTVPEKEQAFNETTTGEYIFGFPSAMQNGTLELAGNSTAGQVQVTVVDDANATVLEQTFSGNFTEALEFTGASTGNWTLRAVYTDYVGSFRFKVLAPEIGAPGEAGGSDVTGGDDQDADDKGPDTDGHKDENLDEGGSGDDKESPAPAILAMLASLVVLARRRR